jgi:hypothetical protein
MKSRAKTQERLIARFGWAAGLLEDPAAMREERLRAYQQALERIAAGALHPEKIAARVIGKTPPPPCFTLDKMSHFVESESAGVCHRLLQHPGTTDFMPSEQRPRNCPM